MPRFFQFAISLAVSIILHVMIIASAVFLVGREETPLVQPTPVRIVNLPREAVKRLPRIARPIPPEQVPSRSIPTPRKFGSAPDITLPGTMPRVGLPGGADEGKAVGKPLPSDKGGPLPFLTQRDIDELARRGMPARKPGDDSVTLDTDEFKFISYNRWLEVKLNKNLKYPELAILSGLQGILYIQIDILKDGTLGKIEILKSSGYKILDDEVIRSIQASAPFQPLPAEWNMDRYSIRGAGIFYLGQGYIR